ncbi:hypothetical protein FCR2A7T_26360 [Flavobacterium cauense R2A-7]|uniref:Uncharacterized protein n=1 Tax=Flavobacterium cauense R2A-7 TaxID=1341154 RepID=V6RYW4_9FLAO|nr:hypothetical protein [Flavobacterium cauense]ESU19212.1 hypothetical protein FCR2A7T_26360 [Flavobacterium cauense R2A-7]KGO82165.1 membrane protein [Flavobacterium cauense R2A-7]TWI15118.1 hypothetical protein IP98_00105 [Flavobacterium cauense R2A-7]
MFSTGQLYFAIFFVIVFVAVMIYVYRKDLALHKIHYKGSLWILFFFLLFIGILFIIKLVLKE